MRHPGFLGFIAVGSLLVGCSEGQVTAPPNGLDLSVSAEPLAATRTCGRVSGAFVFSRFQFTGPTTAVAEGTVLGDLSGTVNAEYFDIQQRSSGLIQMRAHHTITRHSGTISTSDEILGLPDPNPPDPDLGWVRPNSRLEVIGGTGAYAGATGQLHTHGEVNLATLAGAIQFTGQLCVP